MKKAFFNWSSGKDSALALYNIIQEKEYSIETLLTNVNKDFSRISMHGLRESVLDRQVEALDLPIQKLYFPAKVSMELYNAKMKHQLSEFKNQGMNYTVFGDIFLEDLKAYRDQKLSELNIEGVYPLWKKDTKEIMNTFLNLGFKAITVCVNAKLLGKEFVGRVVDESFINDLPDNVDVCGENGEFHTFVFDGPIFNQPVDFKIGEKVLKSYTLHKEEEENCHTSSNDSIQNYDSSFWYCDLY